MSDEEIWGDELKLNNFLMRQTLPDKPYVDEFGIVNLGDVHKVFR